MILGLVRHFNVDFTPQKRFYTSEEFSNAMTKYETSPVIYKDVNLNGIEWDICYCSTIPRAIETAKNIYSGEIIYSDLIVEVTIKPFTKRNISLPSFWWHLGGRIAWYRNHHSQPEGRSITLARINKIMEILRDCNKERILIVTHGFFMRIFVEHLQKNSFTGKIDFKPENGKLYLFKK